MEVDAEVGREISCWRELVVDRQVARGDQPRDLIGQLRRQRQGERVIETNGEHLTSLQV
jgi:hypothetical protein